MFCTIGCLPNNEFSVSSSVWYWPVLVFLGLSDNFNCSNNIFPTCCADAMLNTFPASEKMADWTVLTWPNNWLLYSFKKSISTFTPCLSIASRTNTNGISTSISNPNNPFSTKAGFNTSYNWKVMSASSVAYSAITSNSTSFMLPCPFPFLPISVSIGMGEYCKNFSLNNCMLCRWSGSNK